jgi:hypothetical protein
MKQLIRGVHEREQGLAFCIAALGKLTRGYICKISKEVKSLVSEQWWIKNKK